MIQQKRVIVIVLTVFICLKVTSAEASPSPKAQNEALLQGL